MSDKPAAKKRSVGTTILKVIMIIFLVVLAVREIGRGINSLTPSGGINQSMTIEVNGSRQWINIYGQDRDNPVLLYLHGGPGSATSDIDYAFTRKWSDVYTVVTWDQRNCGKSYDASQNEIEITREILMEDGREVTEFLLDYLDKEKITILGHSWGSIYGANLVLEYPQYYDCFIGVGQLVDSKENELAFIQEAAQWAKDDPQMMKLVEQLDPDQMDLDYVNTRNALMEHYGYGVMANGTDYNVPLTLFFNPHYSLLDWIRYFQRDPSVYLDFFREGRLADFSLKGRIDYEVSYYNVNGDKDYQTNYLLAQQYFEQVNAPYKQLFLLPGMAHGLLESDSEGFSRILHQIAETERKR